MVGAVERFVVVGTALGRTVRQVQRGQVGRHAGGGAVAVVALLVELAQQDLAHPVVLTDFCIHLTVLQRAAVHEGRIDGVPTQSCAVVVGRQVVFQVGLRELVVLPAGRGRQEPPVHGAKVNGALRALEVVDVGRAFVAHSAAVTRNEVGPLGADVERRLGVGAVERQAVHQLGEQTTLRLP